jgi:hypothetical protein
MRRFGGAAFVVLAAALAGAPSASAAGVLQAEWYSDTGLQHLARVDGDNKIDFDWTNQNPPGMDNSYSVRWSGQISPRYSEQYRFVITRDDVARLWIGGQLLFSDNWNVTHSGAATSDPIVLQADHKYDLKLEFADGGGDGNIHLAWKSPSQAKQIVPASRLFAPAPSPTPAPGVGVEAPGPKLPTAPQPEAGVTLAGSVGSGKIRFRKPGSKRSSPLDDSETVPVGSVVDARQGKVELAAEGALDKPQTVEAWGAVFSVGQKKLGDRIVTLRLKPTRGCGRRVQSSKRRQNRLWAHAHGRFRTRGHGSSATVRGTIWSVTDYCGRTVTTVREGLVAVHDFRTHRIALVPAGKRYVAKWFTARR